MFNFLKKKPSKFNATIANTGQTFEVPSKMNLLQAALNAGIKWPHDCRVGSCGTCRCLLKEGKIKPLNDFSYILNKEMMDSNVILACQSRLTSDVTVEVDFDQKGLR